MSSKVVVHIPTRSGRDLASDAGVKRRTKEQKMGSRLYAGCAATIAAASMWICPTAAQAPIPAPLQLEGKIALGDVSGRIDHLAIDLAHKRLFVAELGNDSVGV